MKVTGDDVAQYSAAAYISLQLLLVSDEVVFDAIAPYQAEKIT